MRGCLLQKITFLIILVKHPMGLLLDYCIAWPYHTGKVCQHLPSGLRPHWAPLLFISVSDGLQLGRPEAQTDPARGRHQNKETAAVAVAVACLLPLISAPPKRDPFAQRGGGRRRRTDERKVYYFGRSVGRSVGRGSLGGLLRRQQFRQEVLCHRRRVLRLQRRGVARRRMDLASRSRWLPIISETFLIAKVESSRLCKANSVRSNFVQTLRISLPDSLSRSVRRSLSLSLSVISCGLRRL